MHIKNQIWKKNIDINIILMFFIEKSISIHFKLTTIKHWDQTEHLHKKMYPTRYHLFIGLRSIMNPKSPAWKSLEWTLCFNLAHLSLQRRLPIVWENKHNNIPMTMSSRKWPSACMNVNDEYSYVQDSERK